MTAADGQPLTIERLRPFLDHYVSAWNDRRPDVLVSLMTEDIVYRDPSLPEPARGHDQVPKFMEESFNAFPDLHFVWSRESRVVGKIPRSITIIRSPTLPAPV